MTDYSASIASFKRAIRQIKHGKSFTEVQKRRVRRIAGRNLAHLRKNSAECAKRVRFRSPVSPVENYGNGSSSAAPPGGLHVIVSVVISKLSFASPLAELPKTFGLGYY